MSAGNAAALDVPARITEIEALVADGDPRSAAKRVQDFARDFGSRDHVDEATVHRGELRMLDDDFRQGDVKYEDFHARRRELVKRMVRLVRAIEDRLAEEVAGA
jgi:hypothetical protein